VELENATGVGRPGGEENSNATYTLDVNAGQPGPPMREEKRKPFKVGFRYSRGEKEYFSSPRKEKKHGIVWGGGAPSDTETEHNKKEEV